MSLRLLAFIKLCAFYLIAFTVFRILFYFSFSSEADSFAATDAFSAFWYGFRFDLRLAILFSLPILLLTRVRWFYWHKNPRARAAWIVTYSLIGTVLLVFYAGDLGYYAYLQSRINYRIFEFFKNFDISAQMVWQSYNVPLWTCAILACSYLNSRFLAGTIFTTQTDLINPIRKKILHFSLLTPTLIFGMHSSLGQYPLRWSDAFFTQNTFISALAMNPIHYIFDTAENAKADYDIEKVKSYYPLISRYLNVQNPNQESLNFLRDVESTPQFQTEPNIIYIVMESMVAYKTGAFGNRPDTSPELDRLAESGWLFKNFYTPTEGTARSMFCVVTGIPDINAKSTSSRNPLIINQNTLINGLKGYERFYFIGGNAAWGNIRGVLANNIDNLKMFEGERDSNYPKTDVWGLSDLDLFREAATKIKDFNKDQKTKRPFFALIQSASYHRPYTIPDEHGEFKSIELNEDELKNRGFKSNAELNSFRFSDYSLGEFIRLIETEEFFKNTIVVIHGDHGLPDHEAKHLSEGYKFFKLSRFHTPLVFYSPLIKKPEIIETMITEPDVMPTVLGLTGHSAKHRSLGRNIFSLKKNEPHYAFSYVYYDTPLTLMLYDQNYLAYGNEYEIKSLHHYTSSDPLTDVKEKYPEKFNEMRDHLMGIFETSKYLLHHNPRVKSE